MIQIALFEHLKANVPLISNRVFATEAPQEVTKPYIVFQQISGLRENVHNGISGLAENRFQISSYSTQYLETKQVTVQIKDALQAFTGLMNNDVRVGTILYEEEVEEFEKDTGLYRSRSDYLIKFKEE